MDAPTAQPSAAAPPLVDAYEAYWCCVDEPTDAAPIDDNADDGNVVDAYAEFQALSDV